LKDTNTIVKQQFDSSTLKTNPKREHKKQADRISSKRIWTLDTADDLAEEFRQIAKPTLTDKVTEHQYQHAYAKYFASKLLYHNRSFELPSD